MEVHLAAMLRVSRHRKEAVWRPSRADPWPFVSGARASVPLSYASWKPRARLHANQRVLGRVLDAEDPMLRHAEPPLLRVQEAQPNTFGPWALVFPDRASMAWSGWGMPLLVKQLSAAAAAAPPRRVQALKALRTMGDALCDEQLIPGALAEGVALHAADLLLDTNPWVRESSLTVLARLARTPLGRDKILTSHNLLKRIKVLTLDGVAAVRLRAAAVLHRLVLCRLAPTDMDERDLALFLFYVLDWEEDECILQMHLWNIQTLLVLMSTRRACIDAGALDVLRRIKTKLKDDYYLNSVAYILTKDDPKKYAILSKKPTLQKRFDDLSVVSEKTEKSDPSTLERR